MPSRNIFRGRSTNGIVSIEADDIYTDTLEATGDIKTDGVFSGIDITIGGSSTADRLNNLEANDEEFKQQFIEVQNAITANDADIAQNATDISTNQTNIAQNTTDISTNQTNIAQNTTDISTNQTNIAQNTADILLKANIESPTFTGIPLCPAITDPLTNTLQIANCEFVRTNIANLVDSAPSTLDTLNELAQALDDDPNFATTMTNALASKAPIDNPTFTGTVKTDYISTNSNSTLYIQDCDVLIKDESGSATLLTIYSTDNVYSYVRYQSLYNSITWEFTLTHYNNSSTRHFLQYRGEHFLTNGYKAPLTLQENPSTSEVSCLINGNYLTDAEVSSHQLHVLGNTRITGTLDIGSMTDVESEINGKSDLGHTHTSFSNDISINGNLSVSGNFELGLISNVESEINGKSDSGHTHTTFDNDLTINGDLTLSDVNSDTALVLDVGSNSYIDYIKVNIPSAVSSDTYWIQKYLITDSGYTFRCEHRPYNYSTTLNNPFSYEENLSTGDVYFTIGDYKSDRTHQFQVEGTSILKGNVKMNGTLELGAITDVETAINNHTHTVIDNDLTINGDLTLNDSYPFLQFTCTDGNSNWEHNYSVGGTSKGAYKFYHHDSDSNYLYSQVGDSSSVMRTFRQVECDTGNIIYPKSVSITGTLNIGSMSDVETEINGKSDSTHTHTTFNNDLTIDGDLSVTDTITYEQSYDSNEYLLYPNCRDVMSKWNTEITAKTATICHRGAYYRQTNIKAIKALIELGLYFIELDCQMYLNELYNCHDSDTSNLTGISTTLDNPNNYELIQGNQVIASEKLHKIEEYFMDEFLYKNVLWIIEDKSTTSYTDLNTLLTKYKLKNRVIIQSFSRTNLSQYKTAGYKTLYLGTTDLSNAISDGYDYYAISITESSTYKSQLETAGVTWGEYSIYEYSSFNSDKTTYSTYLKFAFSNSPRYTRYGSNWSGSDMLIPNQINGLITWYDDTTDVTDLSFSVSSNGGITISSIYDRRSTASNPSILCFHERYIKTNQCFRITIRQAKRNGGWTGFYLRATDYLEKDKSGSRTNAYNFLFTDDGTNWQLKIYELTGGTYYLRKTDTNSILPLKERQLDVAIYVDDSSNKIYWNINKDWTISGNGYCDTSDYSDYLDISSYSTTFTDKVYLQHGCKNMVATAEIYWN